MREREERVRREREERERDYVHVTHRPGSERPSHMHTDPSHKR